MTRRSNHIDPTRDASILGRVDHLGRADAINDAETAERDVAALLDLLLLAALQDDVTLDHETIAGAACLAQRRHGAALQARMDICAMDAEFPQQGATR